MILSVRHGRGYAVVVAALGILFSLGYAVAQPFTVQGPGVNTNDFRVTTFASGLDFPLGMARLPDDSLLITVSQGTSFYSSTGRLIRLTDTNFNGVADGAGTVLYSNLPGTLTSLRVADSLVFVTPMPHPIHILRFGATSASPLSLVGKLIFTYPAGWTQHQHSELGVRKTPGYTNRYDLIFQIGAENNFAVTTRTVAFTNENIPGASGILVGDSLYMITIIDDGSTLGATNLTRVASGVRNPAGFAFQPATGDFYFEDNGIDGLVNANEPHSADELNSILRTNLGTATLDFGFPVNYSAYRSNVIVGGAGVQPRIAFRPLPNPANGRESEGPSQITFAPPGFPGGLNTGIFVGFHGKFNLGGVSNEENPLVYADPTTGNYFHFILGQQAGIGHLDGLLATHDSLFVADLVSTGNVGSGAGAGVIYQIKSLVPPVPPTLMPRAVGEDMELTWDRGRLQQANDLNGPWSDVAEAFSPQRIQTIGLQKFYRAVF